LGRLNTWNYKAGKNWTKLKDFRIMVLQKADSIYAEVAFT